jgi:nucleoside-diphosphate-sugar epimerase
MGGASRAASGCGGDWPRAFAPERHGEVRRSRPSRARRELGWEAEVELREAAEGDGLDGRAATRLRP